MFWNCMSQAVRFSQSDYLPFKKFLLKWVYLVHSLEDGWCEFVVWLLYFKEIQFVRFVHEFFHKVHRKNECNKYRIKYVKDSCSILIHLCKVLRYQNDLVGYSNSTWIKFWHFWVKYYYRFILVGLVINEYLNNLYIFLLVFTKHFC